MGSVGTAYLTMPVSIATPSRNPRRTVAFVLAVVLAACGSTSPPSATGVAGPTATPTTPPTPTPVPLRQPIIVQIENSAFARPQSGLSQAGILYQYEAEGGISRFSVLFFTPPTGAVGPVRSARLATVSLLNIYGGTLLYSGAATAVLDALRSTGKHIYDEDSGNLVLFRIHARDPPHNLYTDGTHITGLAQRDPTALAPYALWARTSPAVASPSASASAAAGRAAATVKVAISGSDSETFVWRADLGGFIQRTADTGILNDAVTNKPVMAPTVIIQQVPVATAPEVHDVNGVLGLRHTLTGTGGAQILTGGREYDASWTQPQFGPPSFTLADGSPAPIAPGLVWIVLVPKGTPAVIA